jgi:hypothetical protein
MREKSTKVFRTESDVGDWMNSNWKLGKGHYKVEPKTGATYGFPDRLLAVDGVLVPIELKRGIFQVKTGNIKIEIARQRRIIRDLHENGIASFVLVGVIGTNVLMIGSGINVVNCGPIGMMRVSSKEIMLHFIRVNLRD